MYITLLDPILPAHRQLESLRFPFWDSLTPYPDSAWQKANRNLLVVMEDEGGHGAGFLHCICSRRNERRALDAEECSP